MKGLSTVMERNDVQVTMRVNKEIKERAERLFDRIGLSMSAAFNVFLRKSLDENGVPFSVTTKQTGFGPAHYTPNEITTLFTEAVQEDIAKKHQAGLSVSRYDGERKQIYREYPDGTKGYVDD